MSLGGRVARYEELVRIIGPKLAQCVSARLAGKRVTIGKKVSKVYVDYCRRRAYYDGLRPGVAAALLGCTVRYLKKLKQVTRRLDRA